MNLNNVKHLHSKIQDIKVMLSFRRQTKISLTHIVCILWIVILIIFYYHSGKCLRMVYNYIGSICSKSRINSIFVYLFIFFYNDKIVFVIAPSGLKIQPEGSFFLITNVCIFLFPALHLCCISSHRIHSA